MKNRILTFLIGILTGAIIMTLIYMFIIKPNNNMIVDDMRKDDNMEMMEPGNKGNPPEEMNGNINMKN